MLKLLSLFTGIGAFEKALERINVNYELVGFSEIDKFAIKSYCAIHNITEDKNLGDVSKINIKKIPNFDIMTWGISMSGYKHCTEKCREYKKERLEADYITKLIKF